MKKNEEWLAVEDFNTTFGMPVRDQFSLDVDDFELRYNIFKEEVAEIQEAIDKHSEATTEEEKTEALVEYLDGLADTLYVLLGLAQATGAPVLDAFDAVHLSNMSKLGEDGNPVYFTDGPKKGKVAKGPNYYTPEEDLKNITREAR